MTSPILTPHDWESHPLYLSPGYRSSVLRSPSLPLIPLKENLKNRHVPIYDFNDLTRIPRRTASRWASASP